jgi:DNA (cytosine-5)-methyltransferase 1
VVDLFAGGGGASCGLSAALGREPDVAQNHDELALRVHADNHPSTEHRVEDVWKTQPREVTKGRPVFILWASPDCTHFSAAKGGKPKQKNIRSLAHVVTRWAQDVLPSIIFVENVREFMDWGPLYEVGQRMADGRILQEGDTLLGHPIPERKGETFRYWVARLELLGYEVEWRVLDASNYGAPTKRRRLFIVARCDGEPITWPVPTHGKGEGLSPLRTAAECIDWSIPVPSIFERKKPLAKKTEWRIAEGIRRFVLENPEPFIVGCGGRAGQTPPTPVSAPMGTVTAKNDRAILVPSLVKVNHGGMTDRSEDINAPLSTVTAQRRGHALVTADIAPLLVQTGYGERDGQAARVLDLHEPLGTVMATGQKHALVTAFLAKHFGGVVGVPMDGRPMGTITAKDHHSLVTSTLVKLRGECNGADVQEPMPPITASGTHIAEVRAFLTTYYGSGSQWADLNKPMPTITALHRLGIVVVKGTAYQIVDIGMRMLEPHELLAAQFGRFAKGYNLSSAKTKRDKVRLIGNSVAPECAEAVVRANVRGGATRRAA